MIDLAELDRDPYPTYARLRDEQPVCWVPELNMYFVTRYDDVVDVLQDSQHFVVGTESSTVFDTFGEHMMTVEGALHERYKKAHLPFFTPQNIRDKLEQQIRTHADRLIDDFANSGETELRASFSSRLPVLTMLSLFGLDLDEESQLREWYDAFEKALSNFTWDPDIRRVGQANAANFMALIHSYLEVLRSDAGDEDTLLTALLATPLGERLSDSEICRNALIIFFGGISTVDALILNTLHALSKNPDLLARVRDDQTPLPAVISETIRWLGPVQSATRHVAVDTELRGVTFKAGDTVNCMLAAANHDPAVFENPENFDISRPNIQRQLGFAVGPHHCLGSRLARAEAAIAIERLFTRLPGFSLDPAQSAEPAGYEFRQPPSMTAVWTRP